MTAMAKEKQEKQEKQERQKKGKKAEEAPEAEVPAGPAPKPRLKVLFDEKVSPGLGEKFGLKNPMERPRLSAIVVNVNVGRHLEGAKLPPNVRATVLETISKITGQRPVVIKARKSVSNFKVREGYETAAMVTIRRDRMWHFLDRLINLAAPRIKDFRGLKDNAFDRQGNFSLGLAEQGVFPEINMAEVQFTHGMNINLIFQNSSPQLSRHILSELGMPFRRSDAA
jgi:large subunit ribosomal protein L5